MKGINSLVSAVCGSGKTEIVVACIEYAIKSKLKVGFAIPRRDVVMELAKRFIEIFPLNKVVCVYGGNTLKLEGDLICLTTHQLFRYQNYFDLLIIDEIDAFPFQNNDILESFFHRAVKGNFIMMSATPSAKIIDYFKKTGEVLTLNIRFHNHPLPVPKIIIRRLFLKYFYLIKVLNNYIRRGKQVFVFCPTINICETTYNIIKIFCKNGCYVHSKCLDRIEIIQNFRDKKYMYLITTAVLERGVTIKDLQVIIFKADHKLYNSAALIQIAGRVGRKIDAPDGDVIYIADYETEEMDKSIQNIKEANKSLQDML